MPLPPSNGKIVLVTGINGYIAANLGLLLLEKGYTVRGTSRSPVAKDTLLSDAFKGYESRYQHWTVADITKSGAFDDAVRGVHGIMHTASPVDFSLTTVDQFFEPAVKGNLSILKSTAKAGDGLVSFVLTSSVAAISDRWRQPADHVYTEADWNESGEGVARTAFTAPVAYGASKTAAERAMWTFREEKKPRFACSSVNPSVVTGPPVIWPETPEQLNETLKPLWRIYSGEAKEVPPGIGAEGYVDVRDVAALHVWCLEHPKETDGQRYLANNGKAGPQAMCDILRRAFPDRDIVEGVPGKGYTVGNYAWPEGGISLDGSKTKRALGVDKMTLFDKSILDTVNAFEKKWPRYATNQKQAR